MFAVFAIYFTLPLIALSALPVRCDAAGENCTTLLGVASEDGGYATDPIIGIVSAMDLGSMQAGAELYVGILAVTILVAATNAGVLGVSRLTYSMGLHRQLPDRLRQLHPKYGTPTFGIVIFSAFAIVAILPGQADFLGSIYAFGAMLSFSMAHLALIRLRVTEPDHKRPYRSPGSLRFRGHVLPPFALIGLMGTGLSFVVVSALDLTVAAAGFLWLAIGVVVYVVYRRRQGLDLTSTVMVATEQPVVDREAEYDSILVAFDVNHFVPDAVATAQKLAARRRRGIHVLVWITVPNSSPVNAAMPEQELAAHALIEQTKLLGGRRVSGHYEKIRAGQAGRLVILEAREMRAAAIVMPLPPRVRGGSLFGGTLETVLNERPCRVIIESVPGAERGAVEPRRATGVGAG
jgi:APA family basic amino acid/polyamine antiporter